MTGGYKDFNTTDHAQQPNPSGQDQARARARRQKQEIEDESREFDRHKRAIDRMQELSWDQHRQFSKRLDALGLSASSVLKKRDMGQERLRSLTRIITASQERGTYLARRNGQQLDDIRDGLTSVHRTRVRQLEDQQRDERRKTRS